MTTPNEELITDLQQLANEIEISYRIESIEEAVKALQSQAERIAALETECLTTDVRLATAIEAREKLRAELGEEKAEVALLWTQIGAMADREKALTEQLAEIAATEPVAYRWVWKSKPHDIEGWCYTSTPPNSPELQEIEKLFTCPMPAHDVTELVELTDAQILTLWEETYVQRGWTGIEFARAIERAHGIGVKQ